MIKVYTRNGETDCVLLHIEVQGDIADKQSFAARMHQYFYRIRDLHYKHPLSSLAIFPGQNGAQMPSQYKYEYGSTKLTYQCPTLSILEFTDEDLDKSGNPFAMVIVAAKMRLKEGKIPDEDLYELKIAAARKLTEKGYNTKTRQAIYSFLRNYVLFEKSEMNIKFDKECIKIDKVMTMLEYEKMIGFEEGLDKGREEGRAETASLIVEKLLKGTEFSIEKIAELSNVSIEFVNEIKSQIGTR